MVSLTLGKRKWGQLESRSYILRRLCFGEYSRIIWNIVTIWSVLVVHFLVQLERICFYYRI